MQTDRQMAGERSGIPLLYTPQERPEEWWENVKCVSEYFHHSFLPVALIVVPSVLSIYLTMYSNGPSDSQAAAVTGLE